MADHASVGYWIRRFLSEHLIHERGVSRNTQQSYRDTFCLFLPFVAEQRKTSVDKLQIDDLSVNIVSAFLLHLEQNRSCQLPRAIKGWPRFMPLRSIRGNAALNTGNGARRCAMFHSKGHGTRRLLIWKKTKWTNSFVRQIVQLTVAGEIMHCSCFFTTRVRAPVKQPESQSKT